MSLKDISVCIYLKRKCEFKKLLIFCVVGAEREKEVLLK